MDGGFRHTENVNPFQPVPFWSVSFSTCLSNTVVCGAVTMIATQDCAQIQEEPYDRDSALSIELEPREKIEIGKVVSLPFSYNRKPSACRNKL